MRLILALGAAFAATTMLAYAQTEEQTRVVIHRAGHGGMDADNDGWISRAESAAGADRMFAELDRNHDGRLTEADRPEIRHFALHRDGAHVAPEADDDHCTRTESGEGDERRTTVICRVERHGDGDDPGLAAPVPPIPPVPPAPIFMMMLDEDSEADLNNDGAISQDEFRAQHLRMFDAHDVNGDGRVRAHRPPAPPEPPVPPAPPPAPGRG
jgi:hypothetical protein